MMMFTLNLAYGRKQMPEQYLLLSPLSPLRQ